MFLNLLISPNKLSLAIRRVKSKYTTRLGVSLVNTIQDHSEFILENKTIAIFPVYDSNRNYVTTVRVQDSQYIYNVASDSVWQLVGSYADDLVRLQIGSGSGSLVASSSKDRAQSKYGI